jgi:hypothetical protein
MSISIFPSSTGPLSEAVAERQATEGGNLHSISAELTAERADPETLSEPLRSARKQIDEADEARSRAQGKLREALAVAGIYAAKVGEIVTLQGQVSTAESALLEYRSTIDNAATNFHNWPFQVSRSGHFGSAMREISAQISTAREMVLLLPPWIEDAKVPLQKAEREAEQFRAANKLEKPQNNSSHD